MDPMHQGPAGSVASRQAANALRYVTTLCVVAAIVASSTGRKAVAAEAADQRWKPMVGPWYLWTDPTGTEWDAADIAATEGKGKGKVTFLSRRAPVEPTEHFRAVVFSEGGKIVPLPYNVGGKQEIDVLWYDGAREQGPFLRLSDRWGEYLVDVRRKMTARIVRVKGRTFVGELRAGDDPLSVGSISDTGDDANPKPFVDGRPAREATGPLASDKGKRIGEIRGR